MKYLALILTCLFVIACSSPGADVKDEQGCRLASLEVDEGKDKQAHDMFEERFTAVLNELCAKCSQNRKEIADIIIETRNTLWEKNKYESFMACANAINRTIPERKATDIFKEKTDCKLRANLVVIRKSL